MRRTTTDGITIQGTGRWITIQRADSITPRHRLWDYGDDNGDGTRSAYIFTHYGHRLALGQFIRYGGPWGSPVVMAWEEADGLHFMAGYQADRWDAPLLLELDARGERVRVWQEVTA